MPGCALGAEVLRMQTDRTRTKGQGGCPRLSCTLTHPARTGAVNTACRYELVPVSEITFVVEPLDLTAFAVDLVVSARSWPACFTSRTERCARSPSVLPVSLTLETACWAYSRKFSPVWATRSVTW